MKNLWLIGRFRRALLLSVTAFVTMLGFVTLGAGQANANGPIQLRSRLGDVCLDTPGAPLLAPIVINPCNGTNFQRWNLIDNQQIESAAYPGNCLSTPNTDQLFSTILAPCMNLYSQHWSIQPNGLLKYTLGACLAVEGGPGPGTWVAIRWCNDQAPDQLWDSVS
ncbi:RICIN domain-containing protein [Mycobacterium marinum]|uniref:Rv1419 family lectin n=2 Tax=Mycobacterium marinum TaxID=1781 RepID=UPI003561A069